MNSSRRELLLTALIVAIVSLATFSAPFAVRSANLTGLASENGGALETPDLQGEHSSAGMTREKATVILRASGPISLGTAPVRIPLTLVGTSDRGSFAARLDKLERGRRIYLVLRRLSTTEQPGVLYHLYFDLPAGAKPAKNESRFAGSLNFFDTPNPGAPGPERAAFLSFDITDIARNLKARHLLSDEPTLTISPSGPPAAGAKPVIGEVEIIEQ